MKSKFNKIGPNPSIPAISVSNCTRLIDEDHPSYINFISSLKSPITRKAYNIRLKNYLSSPIVSFTTFDELLNRDAKSIEQGIIEILIEIRYKKRLSYSAQNGFLSAITHFFSINDVIINRKKIKKFMSESENKYEYRSYKIQEIASILDISDEREKTIILLLSSTGMRVGAIHPLRLKDLKKVVIDKDGKYLYQIQVYSSSSKFRYNTYCTPECAHAIDNYLELRRRYGEKLIRTEFGWGPSNIPLIIRAFNKKSSYHIPIPINYRTTITCNVIVPKLKSLNLRPLNAFSDNTTNGFTESVSEPFLHPAHSFRIFAITQMQRARIDKTIREMLVGHSTGLDSVYYKPSEDETLSEYLKAVDNLTIFEKFKLQPSIIEKQSAASEISLLKAKYQEDLISIKQDMNKKFSQIFSLIQQNPVLAHVKPEVLTNTD